MGFDENYILTMSSSRKNDDQDEDCALMIWNEADLGIPDKSTKIEKNQNALKRNCVHPKLIQDPSDADTMYVNTIAEYYGGDTYTGFLQIMIDSSYETKNHPTGNNKRSEKRIEDRAFRFTSVNCPTHTEWYALGTYDADMINLLVYFNWNESKAIYYPLDAHSSSIHSSSIILTTNGAHGSTLPVTGYYVGKTQGIIVDNLCNAPDFGLTAGRRSCFENNNFVGHFSRIEMDHNTVTELSSVLTEGWANGFGTESERDLKNTIDTVFTVSEPTGVAFTDMANIGDWEDAHDLSQCQWSPGISEYSISGPTFSD